MGGWEGAGGPTKKRNKTKGTKEEKKEEKVGEKKKNETRKEEKGRKGQKKGRKTTGEKVIHPRSRGRNPGGNEEGKGNKRKPNGPFRDNQIRPKKSKDVKENQKKNQRPKKTKRRSKIKENQRNLNKFFKSKKLTGNQRVSPQLGSCPFLSFF